MSLITEALSRWLPEALLARGDSRSAIRPPRAIDDARGSSNKAVPGGRLPAGESPGTIKTSVPGGRLAERESPGTIKSSAPDTNNKGSSVGPLIAYHTLGEPVWAPRDYAAFAREGFMQNAIVYPQAVAEARRLTGASGRVAEADLPIVLDDGLATSIAESWLYETWATRESATFKLPPSTLALEPGDIVSADIGGRIRLLRLTDVSEHGIRDIQALSIDPSIYDQIDVPARTATPPPLVQIGPPAVALMDLPQWNASFDASSGYAATMQKPWPESVALFASPQETGYQLKAVATAAATLGLTLDDVPPGPEGRIDRSASFRVRLTNGALSSVDLIAMLAGANLGVLRNADGDWEIIQFQIAELVDAQTYRLSGLLRGQFGTESAMTEALASGAQFVLLDGAVARVPLQESERKLTLNWRYGPGNRNIGDASYVTVPFMYQGLGLRPLSPVHVKGTRVSGDIRLSWIRRSRTGGDNWELPEVPLGEESETYEIDILDGITVKRTLTASTPNIIYTASDQITDFGSVQSSVVVKIYQTNVLFGRGAARSAVV
ncbi:phage tail protein [Hyphomicrobium sp. B1]|uniref:phage tail protein n=1 Tax=Hyphomicrobium sp. B1 TaxID=3075651 RepID=UPI003C306501